MVRARLGDIQFFVYDARRGARESTELEKLLAVYPSVPDPTDLLWAVGLLQGLATFANTFGQARGQEGFIARYRALSGRFQAHPSPFSTTSRPRTGLGQRPRGASG